MKIEVLPLSEELPADVRSAWGAVLAEEPAFASPFFAPEFAEAVGQVRPDARLAVLEEEGRPVGFFPFQHRRYGIGEPAGAPLSDYHGVIVGRHVKWDVKELLSACDLVAWDFDHVLASQMELSCHRLRSASSPYMDLSHGYAAYVDGRRRDGTSQFGQVMSKLRRLERDHGDVRFELHTPSEQVLDSLMSWKSAQYVRTGQTDILEIPWINRCLRAIARASAPRFGGIVSALWVREELAAVHLGMRSAKAWHYWFPAYNQDLGRYSPGIILLLKMAEAASSIGIEAIDLGKGDLRYKQQFASDSVSVAEGTVELVSLVTTSRRLRRATTHMIRNSPLIRPARAIKRLLTQRRASGA